MEKQPNFNCVLKIFMKELCNFYVLRRASDESVFSARVISRVRPGAQFSPGPGPGPGVAFLAGAGAGGEILAGAGDFSEKL